MLSKRLQILRVHFSVTSRCEIQLLHELNLEPVWVLALVLQIFHHLTETARVLLIQFLHDIIQRKRGWVHMSFHFCNIVLVLVALTYHLL